MWSKPLVSWGCSLIWLWEWRCEIQFSNEESGWLRLSPPAHTRLLHLPPSANRMIAYQFRTFMGPSKGARFRRLALVVHIVVCASKVDTPYLTCLGLFLIHRAHVSWLPSRFLVPVHGLDVLRLISQRLLLIPYSQGRCVKLYFAGINPHA